MEGIKIDIIKAASLVRACGKADPLSAIRGATNQAGRKLLRQSEDAASIILEAAREALSEATQDVAELGSTVVPGWEYSSVGERITMLARISGGNPEVVALQKALKVQRAASFVIKALGS